MEEVFAHFARIAATFIEGAAVIVVTYGAVEAFVKLAADIISSVISPTWLDVGQLGAIAVIRTFLNDFLEKDLDNAQTEPGVAKT